MGVASLVVKMRSSARRWVFTLNNYTEEDVERIKEYLTPDVCNYAVVGKEIGEQNNTQHLQGFVHFRGRKTLVALKKNIGNAHFEVARGSDEDNQNYCRKGEDLLVEVGTPAPKHGTNVSYLVASELAARVAGGEQLYALLHSDEKYMVAYNKHMQFVDRMVMVDKSKIGDEAFNAVYGRDHFVMYRWQAELYDILTKSEPDRRKIYWYVDTKGGAGKSTFANMFCSRHLAVKFTLGRSQDIAYVYNREPVVFFDFPRSCRNIEDMCSIMEQLKDGLIFSSKYMSEIKRFAPPHVVVFSNYSAPFGVFSDDRFVLRDISML